MNLSELILKIPAASPGQNSPDEPHSRRKSSFVELLCKHALVSLFCFFSISLVILISEGFSQSAPTALELPWTGPLNRLLLRLGLTQSTFDQDIDQIVGPPNTLQEETLRALESFPLWLQLQTQRFLMTQSQRLFFEPGSQTNDPTLYYRINIDHNNGLETLLPFLRTLDTHLKTEQILDLLIYTISDFPMFPKTQEQWHRFVRHIMSQDILVTGLVFLGLAAINQGQWIFTGPLSRGSTRVGWLFAFENLGFTRPPDLRAGISLFAPTLEGNLVFYLQNHSDNSENPTTPLSWGIENQLRYHQFTRGSAPSEWGLRLLSRYTAPASLNSTGSMYLRQRLNHFWNLQMDAGFSLMLTENQNSTIQPQGVISIEHTPSHASLGFQSSSNQNHFIFSFSESASPDQEMASVSYRLNRIIRLLIRQNSQHLHHEDMMLQAQNLYLRYRHLLQILRIQPDQGPVNLNQCLSLGISPNET